MKEVDIMVTKLTKELREKIAIANDTYDEIIIEGEKSYMKLFSDDLFTPSKYTCLK
jgi:hypothetical protein